MKSDVYILSDVQNGRGNSSVCKGRATVTECRRVCGSNGGSGKNTREAGIHYNSGAAPPRVCLRFKDAETKYTRGISLTITLPLRSHGRVYLSIYIYIYIYRVG